MANKIKPRRSYTANSVPLVSDLEENEMAVNWTDGKIFVRQGNAIVTHALGGSGGGGGSGEDTLLRSLFAPPAPSGLTATGGNAQVSLSWTAPTVLAQTPITDYLVQYSTNSGSTWTTFSDGTSTATSATVTGLTNGTAYVFRVAAVNGVGTGSPVTSGSVTPVEPATSPGAPTGVTATNGGIATDQTPSASVSWTAPASNGGASITDYIVQFSSNGGSSWTTLADGTSTATSVTIDGGGVLAFSTPYVFRVAAVNSVGTGTYSSVSNSMTTSDDPNSGGA